MAEIGYIRVSTFEQNTARQLADVALDEIFEEKASAESTNRPILQECLRYVRKGDVLHVHSIDRLARNLEDLLSLLHKLTEKNVEVRFHKEKITFSNEKNHFSTLQLHIIGAVAEFERALIKERQKEGIARAKKEGIRCGRPPALTDSQLEDIMLRIKDGANKKDLAHEYNISKAALYQSIKRYKNKSALS